MTKSDDETKKLGPTPPKKLGPTPPKVRPLHDNVLVRVLPRPEKSAGGILLPGDAKGREDRAEVLACGPRVTAECPAPGAVVCFDPYKVRMVIDAREGFDITGSAHAKAGQLAIVAEDALRYVVEPDGAA